MSPLLALFQELQFRINLKPQYLNYLNNMPPRCFCDWGMGVCLLFNVGLFWSSYISTI